jgi:hypothetical protein
MTYVHFVQADGAPRRAHLDVPMKGRRRLSAFLRERDLDTGLTEPMFVSVTRANRLQKLELGSFVDAISRPDAEMQVMRADWSKTVIGSRDVVTITYLPLGGGGGSQGGGRKSGLAIGASVAAIVLAIALPFVGGPLAAGLATATGLSVAASTAVVSAAFAGVIIGLNYLASRAGQAKANKESDNRPIYGVSGGGNLPKPGDRIPWIGGLVWTVPALSQPDYSVYSGEDQVLFKRMTIGCGEYTLKAVRIGTQEVWRDGAYLNGLGAAVQLEYIAPGGTSTLVPSSVTASPDVAGIDLPRPGSAPEWSGPYRVSPAGVNVSILQFNIVCPGGVFAMGPTGSKFAGTSYPTVSHPYIQYAPADGNGNPIGGWTEVPDTAISANSQKPVRRTFTVTVPAGQYVVRAKNLAAEIPSNQSGANGATWDFAGGYIPEAQIRPGISELSMQIKAGPGLSITQFSQIECLVQRKLPVWRSGNFTVQESRKALDAFVDIATDPNYGAGMPPELIDLGKVAAYLGGLTEFDTFDGQINGPVSVWEAWSTVLGPMRSEPIQRGTVISFQRDEPQTVRRHHFTRRQILSGSTGAEVNLNRGEGVASIRSEFYTGGDSRRRNEVTARYGPESLTSTLVNFEGVTDHKHATHLTKWTAASNFYRRETGRFRVELQHRSILPGDMIGVDRWFFSKGITLGLAEQIAGNTWRFRIDGDAVWPSTRPAPLYAFIIDRQGREFGPLFCDVNEAERWIDLNPVDVTAAQVATGISMAQALQPDDGGSTTHIRIGTLTELTENWIVKAVRPIDEFTADIEVVNDAPEVWDAIGEGYTTPPQVFEAEETDPPIPRVRWVSANVAQVQQSLICRWACSPARGAVNYEVQVSRDNGATWGPISNGPSTTGEFAIEHRDDAENLIRARASGRFGVSGPWVESPFFTVLESVTGVLADELEDLFARARAAIAAIAAIGENSIRDTIKKLNDQVERLAAAAATEAGNAYQKRELIKVQLEGSVNQAFAAIEEERITRVSETEALASIATALAAQLTAAELELTGTAVALEELTTTVTLQGSTLTSASAEITSLQSRMTSAEGVNTGQATAIGSLNTSVSSQGSSITTIATNLTALNTVVAGNSATLTTYGESIDGISLQYGITGTINGVTGGFRFSGTRRLDGLVSYAVEIVGNLVVDGTISGLKLQTTSIITGSAQIGNLIVDNISIKNGAISRSNIGSSGGTSVSISLDCRGGGSTVVACIGMFMGLPGYYFPLGTGPGQVRIFRNGTLLYAVGTSYEASGSGGSAGIALLATPIMVYDNPPTGVNSYVIDTTNAGFVGGLLLMIQEISK